MPRLVDKLPRAVRLSKMCHRFSYLSANAILIWMATSLKHSVFHEGTVVEFADTVAFAVLFVTLSIISYLVLQASNPGYIEVEEQDVEEQNLLAEEGRAAEPALDALDDVDPPAPAASPEIPLRTHYCKVCKLHVATFDHHCGVLGTCIGERNHCRFLTFLFFQMCALSVGLGVVHSAFRWRPSVGDWMSYNAVALFLAIVFWILFAFVGGLFAFHLWLAMTNSTSYELFKKPGKIPYLRGYKDCDLPFSNGIVHNMKTFCCLQDGCFAVVFNKMWRPRKWRQPGPINRNSDDILENWWENSYYSCC